ncbi:conserved unknown protein [Ectocarpus siliculosus]|uniref:Thioredoxin domain-containing protein n=1 Tax=Ectocarpus siliculosus TaxID=2880 RepID=D7FI16_ECTSI|nr:conserved unknown protein [Ectocarpus siliculosus]|eukprot:CBJ34161.1 conserved unknown protein [Ectocarpus siliculosus]
MAGFPSIKVFGADKRNPTDFNGERTTTAIVTGGMAAARDLVKSRQGGGAKKKPSATKDRKADSGGSKGSSGGSRKKAGGKAVVDLTENNFKEMVLDSDEMWLVEFFAPWCGHCKKLEPEWESAAGQLSGSVNQFTAAQKVVEGLMAGEAPEPAAEAEEAAPATEEAAADPSTDAAADALQNLSVGTGAEEAAPTEKA